MVNKRRNSADTDTRGRPPDLEASSWRPQPHPGAPRAASSSGWQADRDLPPPERPAARGPRPGGQQLGGGKQIGTGRPAAALGGGQRAGGQQPGRPAAQGWLAARGRGQQLGGRAASSSAAGRLAARRIHPWVNALPGPQAVTRSSERNDRPSGRNSLLRA
jgi:hypothetical protein